MPPVAEVVGQCDEDRENLSLTASHVVEPSRSCMVVQAWKLLLVSIIAFCIGIAVSLFIGSHKERSNKQGVATEVVWDNQSEIFHLMKEMSAVQESIMTHKRLRAWLRAAALVFETRQRTASEIQFLAGMSFDGLMYTANRILLKFIERSLNTTYHGEGVLYSEGLALVSAMSFADVDVMLESGTANGQSTELMARYFAGTPTKIITMDADVELLEKRMGALTATANRLKQFPNVTCLRGDGFKLIPKLLAEHKGKRIGAFIDGPKKFAGLQLVMQTLANTTDVKFVAMHDVTHSAFGLGVAKFLQDWNRTVLYTWDRRWRTAFSPMDELTNYKPGSKGVGLNGWGIAVMAGIGQIPLGTAGDSGAWLR